MKRTLTILGIHGLGDHRNSPWKRDWQDAIRQAIPQIGAFECQFSFFEYDRIFEEVEVGYYDSLKALYKLLASGVRNWWEEDPREGRFGLARSDGVFAAARDKLRWTAGYVAAWVEDEEFRQSLREELLARISSDKPDIILGHSLGSLIAYDALISNEAYGMPALREHLQNAVTYVSLGSQIGNPFVIGNLHSGRIMPLPVHFWFHLYNSEDDVFTAPIQLPGVPNYRQVNAYFDIDGWMDHNAVEYLKHPATVQNLWTPLVQNLTGLEIGGLGPSKTRRSTRRTPLGQMSEDLLWRTDGKVSRKRPDSKKALLVGINEYPDPRNRLSGCINDVFLMSSLLQESGYDADDIRIVINDRATAKGILTRMDWLLEDALPGDRLVFYFSGHGARMPAYNAEELADHVDEALVAYDFDWSPERAILDDQIFQLYSQLHYDTRFTMIFDCCHSGGVHRDGGPSVRGLAPPDDIRHRALRWDSARELWIPREFAAASEARGDSNDWWRMRQTHRLGHAMTLREQASKHRQFSNEGVSTAFEQNKKLATRLDRELVGDNVAHAPYLPLIIHACGENELAYEYRHGVESYGAFTFLLSKHLRPKNKVPSVNVSTLISAMTSDLREIGHAQHPEFLSHSSTPESLW